MITRAVDTFGSLQESLAAIRDVLWLLDYYCGHAWAFDYLRPTTQAALRAPRAE